MVFFNSSGSECWYLKPWALFIVYQSVLVFYDDALTVALDCFSCLNLWRRFVHSGGCP